MTPTAESTATVIRMGSSLRLSSDARLARLAARGDRAAFAAIFDRYHQQLYRYCVSILHDAEDAADALQSTMLRALRSLEGDDRDIAVRPWLYRIAHNESVTILRDRPNTQPALESGLAGMADVEGSAALRDQLHTLLGDIRELPDRQRAALVMREMAGLSYPEIAAALDSSPAGAKQAVYDARRALLDLSRGREQECGSIQKTISAGDGRAARGRSFRAHLRACSDCRTFQTQIGERQQQLAGLTPVLPAAVAASVLKGALVGAGGTSAESVLFGVGTGLVANAATTVAVTVALGAGVVGMEAADGDAERPVGRAPAGQTAPPPGTGGAIGGAAAKGTRSRSIAARDPGRRGSATSERARRTGSGAEGDARKRKRARTSRDADEGGATVAAPTPGASPRRSGGRLGIRKPGHNSGGGSRGDSGPVRTGVDEVRGTVDDTVDGIRGQLPIQTPELPPPVGRPTR